MPARTIRYYQSVGLLPKPRRRGKEAVYGPRHEERLRTVASMRSRGLRLDAIREVLDRSGPEGGSVAEWLGLVEYGPGPWSDDRDRTFTDDEFTDLLGDRRAELTEDLIAEKYVQQRDDKWFVPDFPLFKAALMLSDVGTSIPVAARLRDLIRARIAAVANEMIAVVVREAGAGYAGEATMADLSTHLHLFRPGAWEAFGHVAAQEIERAINNLGDQA
jgi:DNA-binding transcriptional MerR regulator